jgi:hypothetical protein
MAKEYLLGIQAIFIKVTTLKTFVMGMERCIGMMAQYIKETGLMVTNKEKEYFIYQMVELRKEFLNKIN